jgi:Mycoplasma protein of unknown function, DUF285
MSSAINTSKMFWHAWAFNGNVSLWEVSDVKDMSDMFGGTRSFIGIGLDQWNPIRVENRWGLFAGSALVCEADMS